MGTPISEGLNRADGATQDFKAKVQVAEKQLAKFSHDTGAKVGAMASGLVESASDYAEASRDYVKENPAKSVAIAAAAGLVAGSLATLLMRRPSKS